MTTNDLEVQQLARDVLGEMLLHGHVPMQTVREVVEALIRSARLVDELRAENAELRKRAEAGDARRVFDLLRKSRGAFLFGPCGDGEWIFSHNVGLTELGSYIANSTHGDTPESAILAALEETP